ncbi:MAG: hypothetical protein ACOCR8_03255, partial [Desulfosalsimonas sp.]
MAIYVSHFRVLRRRRPCARAETPCSGTGRSHKLLPQMARVDGPGRPKAARRDLCGGPPERVVSTAT